MYLRIKVLICLHSVSLLHQYVHNTGLFGFHVDEHLHTHDAVQDGVQRHDDRLILHQNHEAVAGAAAPPVPQDDGLR